ncbi:MAG: hypothetical protein RLZZ435_681 [Cyanobacteriota bacterium]|jgi:ABC-type uncharacterized transport system involved in gliding motility auxiliary subunit
MKASSRQSSQKSLYWQLTLWLGAFLTLAGFSAGFIIGQWSNPIVLGVLLFGTFILCAGIIARTAQPQFWQQRSTQAGANALLSVIAVVLILGVINIVAVQKTARFDFTENQRYSLSPQSQEVVANLQEPVKLWIFDEAQSDANRNLLDNYQRISNDRFSYEFVDPREQPSLAQKFGVQNFGEVYLEVNNQPQRLQTLQGGAQSQGALSESALTNALARVNTGQSDTVYFLQGHGEYALTEISQATDRLQERGFVSSPLNLAQTLTQGQDIPPDAAVVVVAGPQRPLFEQETASLATYLAQGGNALLLIDPRIDAGMDPLLKPWGVTLDPGLVIDGGGGVAQVDQSTGGLVGFGPTAPLINTYGSHPITQDFGNGNSFYPFSRAIVLDSVDGVNATEILSTNDASWAETNIEEDLKFDPGQDLEGPLVLGVALDRPVAEPPAEENTPETDQTPPSEERNPESRLVVIGNSSFATNGLFQQQLNGDVFTNAVVWLSQREGEVLSISPKDPTNRRIQLQTVEARWVIWLSLIMLPLTGFGLGGFLWWKRR